MLFHEMYIEYTFLIILLFFSFIMVSPCWKKDQKGRGTTGNY